MPLLFRKIVPHLQSATSIDFSLWEARKKMKRPAQFRSPVRSADDSWTRRDAKKETAFIKHMEKILLPPLPQMELRLRKISTVTRNGSFSCQVTRIYKEQVDPRKAPGHDLITAKMLKGLPEIVIIHVIRIFKVIPRLSYYRKA